MPFTIRPYNTRNYVWYTVFKIPTRPYPYIRHGERSSFDILLLSQYRLIYSNVRSFASYEIVTELWMILFLIDSLLCSSFRFLSSLGWHHSHRHSILLVINWNRNVERVIYSLYDGVFAFSIYIYLYKNDGYLCALGQKYGAISRHKLKQEN